MDRTSWMQSSGLAAAGPAAGSAVCERRASLARPVARCGGSLAAQRQSGRAAHTHVTTNP